VQLTPIRVGGSVATRDDAAQSSVKVELAEAPSLVAVMGTADVAMGQENDSLASPEAVVVTVALAGVQPPAMLNVTAWPAARAPFMVTVAIADTGTVPVVEGVPVLTVK
jgi:hypothetical protein